MLATEIQFRHAAIRESDPLIAFAEFEKQIGISTADAAVLFVSSGYDLPGLAEVLRTRCTAPVLCCTTAGEISSSLGYTTGTIAASAITGCRAELLTLCNLSTDTGAIDAVLPDACQYIAGIDPQQTTIGLLVVDGLCKREEAIVARLQNAMPTVRIVGGSAGDNCEFKQTLVYANGQFQSNAATVLLLSGEFEATVFQTHHFVSSGIRAVATDVAAEHRRLITLDGLPAATRMAQLLDCPVENITTDWLATRPLMLKIGDTLFVRSVQTVNSDGSFTMLCAIHEGEILHVGKAGQITDTTGSYFQALRHRQAIPDLVIGFDCILRRTELALRGRTSEMNAVLGQFPFVGFSTFGEQYDGQHVNQTMTGVALWKK